MRTSLIIFAIIVVTGLSGVTGSAQEKGKARGNRQIVGGAGGAGSLAVKRNNITIPTGSGNDTFRSARVKDGTSNTLMSARSHTARTETVDKNESITVHGRSSRVTFEGNNEPLWAKTPSSSRVVQGNQIGTNARPRRSLTGSDGGVADTTEERSSAMSVGSAQTNTVGGPRRHGLFGDSNGDGDVDGADYVLRSSSQKNGFSAGRRSGVAGGDFNPDHADTVGRSSLNNASRPQSLSAGTYGRGNRQNGLMALLIP